jgi:predicted translin family RNA/ssDNA-binding protein
MNLNEFYEYFQEHKERRKRSEELSNRIAVSSKEAIENRSDVEGLDELFEEAFSAIKEDPSLYGLFERSFCSYCEAKLFLSFLKEKKTFLKEKKMELPESIDARTSMEALKRLVKDLRRYFIEMMERAEIDEARAAFEAMDELLKLLEKLGEETEDFERMVERSREELYDYKRKREDLDIDDVWFRR